LKSLYYYRFFVWQIIGGIRENIKLRDYRF